MQSDKDKKCGQYMAITHIPSNCMKLLFFMNGHITSNQLSAE